MKEATRRDIQITHETITRRRGVEAVIHRQVVFRNKSLGIFLAVDRLNKHGDCFVKLNSHFDL